MAEPPTYDNSMPSQYTSDPPKGPGPDVGDVLDLQWVKSMQGILKVVQVVLSLITFICASSNQDFIWHWGGGWVQFVSMTSFIVTLIFFLFYIFHIITKLPKFLPMEFIEFVYYVGVTVCFFISGIVSAVKGGVHAAIGAAAFFCFASMVAYGIDIWFKLQVWRAIRAQNAAQQQSSGQAEVGGFDPNTGSSLPPDIPQKVQY